MEIFTMIFALIIIAIAILFTIAVGIFMGSMWAALGFVALLVLLYRVMTYQSGPPCPMKRDQLNAFQRPLSRTKRKF